MGRFVLAMAGGMLLVAAVSMLFVWAEESGGAIGVLVLMLGLGWWLTAHE